jgi:hypothetical protein
VIPGPFAGVTAEATPMLHDEIVLGSEVNKRIRVAWRL